ncbi:VWA domain-containing protein [Spongorhabdus nitratireducens]
MNNHLSVLQDDLKEEYSKTLRDYPILEDNVLSQLNGWESDLLSILSSDFPFLENEELCKKAEYSLASDDTSIESIEGDLEHFDGFLCSAKLPRDRVFWDEKILDLQLRQGHCYGEFRQLLQREWRKQLSKKRAEWEIETASQFRRRYLEQLKDWLEKLSDILKYIESLGLEPGFFLDFSKGSISLSDIDQLKRWADYLSTDQGVKNLCELLGKMRLMSLSEKLEAAKTVVSIPSTFPDINSKEEITGIKLGKEIEHALPSELALLSDPETAILFDLKYVESRLMCFDLEGVQRGSTETEIEEMKPVTEKEKMGPIVICVDTSGSMHGSPETIAKAVTLYLATTAKEQERDCYLINFSTGIETLDLSGGYSLGTLISFLQKSFYGGTDVAPAIRHGLSVMQGEAYKNADMLIISDFVMGSLPTDMLKSIELQRERGNRFYSLCIGDEFMSNRLKSHFDREWIYDPYSSSIRELIKIQNDLLEYE